MSEPTPQVTLDVWTMWCPRHLEPYRRDWPIGYAKAMILLFNEAIALPAIADAAKGDANSLTAALERFKPICCFVSHKAMQRIYRETDR